MVGPLWVDRTCLQVANKWAIESALPSLAAGMLSVVVGDGLTKGSLRSKGRGLGAWSRTRAGRGRTGGERGEECSLRRCCSTKI